MGFVDELGNFDDAVKTTKKIAGITTRPIWSNTASVTTFPSSCASSGQSDSAHNIKLDLGVEMPKLQAGELYFLSPTFVN